ncbi:MAG: c-type cytochrome [Planctomycetota bacterium]|nr:c-type cytochrome [Planctomycetota bacterium]
MRDSVIVCHLWAALAFAASSVAGQTEIQQLMNPDVDAARIAAEGRLRGDARRGAIVFHNSAAGCAKCHLSGEGKSPLGPDLARLGDKITDVHLVEALLQPSKSIREGFHMVQLLTNSGEVKSGMLVREDDKNIVLRDIANLQVEITVEKSDVDVRSNSQISMMPEGLAASLKSQRELLDLLSYLFEIHKGGPETADQLKPSAELLIVTDDTANLNHAQIIRKAESGKSNRGQQIYESSCIQCHGADGNKPSLATARAFGTQKLKFGADPYSMFKTLSHGNGLMAAASALSPGERYEVVTYIRNRFMKGSNPDYQAITEDYLQSLPTGSEMGEFKPAPDRDYGPALASQLGREVNCALSIKLGEMTIAYDLHTMDQAEIWSGGFLNVDDTQHKRGRGEGYPEPRGKPIESLGLWRWGHDGTLDYPQEELLARGPMPQRWLDFYGHYLYDDKIVLSYAIDGRAILEVPSGAYSGGAIRHTLRIGPGKALVLAAGKSGPTSSRPQVTGDMEGVAISADSAHRWAVKIPADERARLIDIVCFAEPIAEPADQAIEKIDPSAMVHGGKLRWPDVISTVGYRGFQTGAYAVDSITIPESTPWNTWFRTSAIDFFPDGRMAVATVGGDVWIVSGVDGELLNLRWKRFAGGMFEPLGIKVVNGLIYVTCRDRLTRLHDLNADGEADFYESFSADTDVSTYFHAFNFDLQTDSSGNFYYAKNGQYTDYKLPGAIIKVSPDGKTRDVVCTGLRTPNGMGIFPDGRLTVSDNQGTWMPASKVSLVRPSGFYGYVQNQADAAWAPDGGKIDIKSVIPPKTFDQPLIWMPQEVDNSSGGQLFVEDRRFGPLAGRLLHMSYGQGNLFYLMIQQVGESSQAALVKFPHDFGSGIMRGRVNAVDGQVYVAGLNGWNDNGRGGLADGGIYRVRYTGQPVRMITDCEVHPGELKIEFNFALDPKAATNLQSYSALQWNYQWTSNYGSDAYHPETGEMGKQLLTIDGATLRDDGKTLVLQVPKLRPVDQLHLRLSVSDVGGSAFSEDIYWTIHAIPSN